MSKIHRQLAWAWLIIIGGLMIYPRGIECIVCGRPGTIVIGVISIVLGLAGFAMGGAGKSVSG